MHANLYSTFANVDSPSESIFRRFLRERRIIAGPRHTISLSSRLNLSYGPARELNCCHYCPCLGQASTTPVAMSSTCNSWFAQRAYACKHSWNICCIVLIHWLHGVYSSSQAALAVSASNRYDLNLAQIITLKLSRANEQ